MAKTNSTGSGSELTQESMVKIPGNEFNEAAAPLRQIEEVVNQCACLAIGVSDIILVEDIEGDALSAAAFVCRSINEKLNAIAGDLMRLQREGASA